jgi:hypothetical protein
VQHSLPKMERIFMVIVQIAKGVEIDEILVYYTCGCIWLKCAFGYQIHLFSICLFNKSFSFSCGEEHRCT